MFSQLQNLVITVPIVELKFTYTGTIVALK